jgi:hypothetical protein
MASPKSWLVVNARSGSNSEAALMELEQGLAERELSPARKLVFPEDELPTPESLNEAGVGRLIVYTGDGSLNAVIDAVSGWSGEVLVLPGGTMNLLSLRLHGSDATTSSILNAVERGAARRVRPLMACCEKGRAHAGLLIGPGTAWVNVREAMRDADVAGLAQETSEALAETTSGSRVRMIDPEIGHADGYPLLEVTPSHRGMQVDGYRSEGAGDLIQHTWALLRRRFREGPHERLGLWDEFTVENCAGEAIEVLIDGEPATLGARSSFTVAPCEVDLLATSHGF